MDAGSYIYIYEILNLFGASSFIPDDISFEDNAKEVASAMPSAYTPTEYAMKERIFP